MTQYSKSAQSSTSTDVLRYELTDQVQQYSFASALYEFTEMAKIYAIFALSLQFNEPYSISLLVKICFYQIMLSIPNIIGKVGFEIISPLLGSSQVNAGKVVFNYSFINYLAFMGVILLIYMIVLGSEDLLMYAALIPTHGILSFMFSIGKTERWNLPYIVVTLISGPTTVLLYAVINFYNNYAVSQLLIAYAIPGAIFAFVILRQGRYLYVNFQLIKPFRPALQLQQTLFLLQFIFWDFSEDFTILLSLKLVSDTSRQLSICLYYLAMKISSIPAHYLYDYYIQSMRLAAITLQPKSLIHKKTTIILILSIVFALVVYLTFYPFFLASVGQNLTAALEMTQYTKVLQKSNNGALRGVVQPFFSLAQAHFTYKKSSFIYFLNTANSLSIIILFLTMYFSVSAFNFVSFYTIQTINMGILVCAGVFQNFFVEKGEKIELNEEIVKPSGINLSLIQQNSQPQLTPKSQISAVPVQAEEGLEGNFLSNQSVNFLQFGNVRNVSMLESVVNNSILVKSQVLADDE